MNGRNGDLGERVRDQWRAEDLRVCPAASAAEIAAFEERYAVRLPAELRAFLQTANGLDGQWDAELLEWYPLSRWRPLTGLGPEFTGASDIWFLFADYSLEAVLYGVGLNVEGTGAGPVLVYWGGDPPARLLFASWREWVKAYLQDPKLLLP